MIRFSTGKLVALLGLVFLLSPVQAAVITEGDAVFDGDIRVAQQFGDGSLTITAPTVLQGGGIFIADRKDYSGNVIVDGGTYQGGGNFYFIGLQGNGNLEILNGGTVTTNGSSFSTLQIAEGELGTGNVLVSGNSSLLDMPDGIVSVGVTGSGFLTVQDGAIANHRKAHIGGNEYNRDGGVGRTTITGSGSRWNIYGDVNVGSAGGAGELWIQDGGYVHGGILNSGFASIGHELSSGLVVVEGPNSLWQEDLGVIVGANGSGTVTVRSGAEVRSLELSVGGRTIDFFCKL